MDKIILEGLEFYAFHGFFKEEQKIGCPYFIDLEIYTDLTRAAKTDKLEDTINYADVYSVLKQEMAISSKLIEHVGGRIVGRLFSDFKKIEGVKLSLSKVNPAMGGKLKSTKIVMEKWREK